MRINLTFAIQLGNILLTIWFLKNFFWKRLLFVVTKEQEEQKAASDACCELEKEVENKKIAISLEQNHLTKMLKNKMQNLDTPQELNKKNTLNIQKQTNPEPNTALVQKSSKKIMALLDKKF